MNTSKRKTATIFFSVAALIVASETILFSTPVSAHIPSALLAYSFDEGSGTTLNDSSGHGNNGELANAPTWAAGQFGTALSFDGSDDYVTVPNLDVPGSEITIMTWVNNTSFPFWVDQRFVSKASGAAANDHYWMLGQIGSNGNERLRFRLKTGGTTSTLVASSGNLTTNTWYHAAATYNGSAMRLYLNGVEVGSTAKSGPITTDPAIPVNIGRSPDGSNYTSGRLDELRILDHALTPAEIQEAMNTPVGEPLPPDTTPPTVSVTSPTAGSTVSGTATLGADASDDVIVAGVQFRLNGENIGAEDATAPFEVLWDSTTVANGPFTLTAQARDLAGNTTMSDPVSVSVLNTDLSDFVNEIVVPDLNFVTSMEFLPDGKILLGDVVGNIWVVQSGGSTLDSTPFLTIPNVVASGDKGMLDLALDPNFSQNGYVYAFYAHSSNTDRVSRFTADAGWNGASASSEVVLWQSDVTTSTLHHGATIAFGPDGRLYISTGDNGNPSGSQSLTTLNGKILRINPDGTIPADNPFHDGAGPNRDAIWAFGLRNPFRMSFDIVTGDLFIGDVGGNDYGTAQEEVNLGVAGANYGWPLCEGTCSIAGVTSPAYSYAHNGRDASITGGFVYRGTQFPSEFYGSYFYGDYSQNWLRRLSFDAAGSVAEAHFFEPEDGSLDDPSVGDIVELKEGPDGALYYLDLNFDDATKLFNQGALRRIRYLGDENHPPTAVASADPSTGTTPLTVNFSSAGSSDPEGSPLTFTWDFGDGSSSTDADPVHVYDQSGSYDVVLTVSDGTTTGFDSLVVSVGSAPTAGISNPVERGTFVAGDSIPIVGTGSDTEDGELPASAFQWNVVFHHEGHVHPDSSITGAKDFVFAIPTSGHDFSGFTRYEIILTVTDSDGLQHTTSVTIFPEKVDLSFDTVPSGLTLELDGISRTTPFVHDTLVGFQHTIQARDQTGSGSTYSFQSWSDAGSQTHGIVVPAQDASYIASFTATAITGLEGLWKFDDGGGTTAVDGSGKGRNGTLVNGPTWTPNGQVGSALVFDGSNDYVSLPTFDLSGSSMTMTSWVKFNGLPNGTDQRFISKATDESVGGHFWMLGQAYNGAAHRLRFRLKTGGITSTLVATTGNLSTGVWYHAAAVYNGSTMKLYLNGVEVGSLAKFGTIGTSTSANVNIGRNPGGSANPFNGTMDDVRIYNRALSQGEIQTVMSGA